MVLASKKSSRTAAEGLLAIAQNEKMAAVIELNCETDFVARNEIFQYLVSRIFCQTVMADSRCKIFKFMDLLCWFSMHS